MRLGLWVRALQAYVGGRRRERNEMPVPLKNADRLPSSAAVLMDEAAQPITSDDPPRRKYLLPRRQECSPPFRIRKPRSRPHISCMGRPG